MKELFQLFLYQPIATLFAWLYQLIPDLGVAILLLTIIIKLLLYPLNAASIRAQASLAALQPKLDEIKKKNAGNQQMIAQETMRMYKEHKVNPFGSCLTLAVQLPVFIALYWVLQSGLVNGDFNTTTLGLWDLGKRSIVLAVLAGAAQYLQAKSMVRKRPPADAGEGAKDESMAAMMNKQMLYMMPALTVIIGMQLPAGLSLYWLLSTILTIVQQKIMTKNTSQHAAHA